MAEKNTSNKQINPTYSRLLIQQDEAEYEKEM